LDEFLHVNYYKYVGRAEAWEGVQSKIGILKDDLRVSDVDFQPEFTTNVGMYQWHSFRDNNYAEHMHSHGQWNWRADLYAVVVCIRLRRLF
jgi:hypothetical protein